MAHATGSRLRLWALAVAAALVFAACGGGGSKPAGAGGGGAKGLKTIKPGELQVGSCLDYAPFEYFHKGTLKGFDVDMVQAIAKKLGLKVKWVKANFNTIFGAVAAHKFDMVAAASTITPERAKHVNFSEPYYNAQQGFTVNAQKTPDIKSTDDLKSGDIIGVQKGTTGKDWAESHLASKGAQIKTFTNAPDAFTDLEAGNITGIVNDLPSSEQEVKSRPGLKVVQAIDTGEHYGFAFAPDTPKLTVAVNKALNQIVADGTYAKIFKKYFPGTPVPPKYQPNK
jgi:polar amino acid transport system substrate-binding protein